MKKCERCGKLFTYVKVSKRFCSQYCQKLVWTNKHKPQTEQCKKLWAKYTGRTSTYYRQKTRLEVINNYSGKCMDCGEVDPVVLTIDHVKGGGKQHRAELISKGNYFYCWLKKNNFPKDGFELVCRNCNWRRWMKRKE